MDKNYKISVVTPLHETDPDVFKRSFLSVVAQSIGFENIEYIIVVHNSADCYRIAVENLADGYENVKVLVLNNEFKTPASPRNYGLKHATGDYIAFLDSDDIFYPDALLEAYKAITEEQAQICMFRFDNLVGERVLVVRQFSLFDQTVERHVLHRGQYDQKKLIAGMNLVVHTKLFEGAFIRDNNFLFDDTISCFEDGPYNITLFAFAEKIVILPQLIGLQYYQNDGSAMQTFNRKEDDLLKLCQAVEKTAEIGWKYGMYVDAYVTEIASNTAIFILCSDVHYSFLKKAAEIIVPVLNMTKPIGENKVDHKANLKAYNILLTIVYRHPLVAAFIEGIVRIFHIDLEKIIKESIKI